MSLLSLILGFCLIYLRLLSQADQKKKEEIRKERNKSQKKKNGKKEGRRERRKKKRKRKEERKKYFQFLRFLDRLG